MSSKSYLDQRIAFISGLTFKDVSLITRLFLEGISAGLKEDGEVYLKGLGTFHVRRVKHPHTTKDGRVNVDKIWVGFSKSPALKKELEEHLGKVRR
jgi:nucleoid DNA-binding protein